MQNRSTLFDQQSRNLLIFLVVAGYIVTFINAARGIAQYSAAQIVIGVLFGVVYLIVGMFDTELLRRFPANTRQVIYFSVQCTLTLGVGLLLLGLNAARYFNKLKMSGFTTFLGILSVVGGVGEMIFKADLDGARSCSSSSARS
jgi:hypothetical protein